MKTTNRVSWTAFLTLFASVVIAADDLPPVFQRIKANGKLVVAMYEGDTPPFFMLDKKGELFGLDVQIAKDIASKMGVKIEFDRNHKSFNQVIDAVVQRKADLSVSDLSATLNRAMQVRMSQPYVTVHHAILVDRMKAAKLKAKTERELISKLDNKEAKIGVNGGSSFGEYVKSDFPNATIVAFNSDADVFQAISDRTIDAALIDEPAVREWQHEHPKFSLTVQTLVQRDRFDGLAVAVNWKDTHLLYWLNQYFDSVRRDGTLDRWVKEYLEDQEWRTRMTK